MWIYLHANTDAVKIFILAILSPNTIIKEVNMYIQSVSHVNDFIVKMEKKSTRTAHIHGCITYSVQM